MELKTVMRNSDGEKGLRDLCLAIDEKIGGKITIVEIGSYSGESAVIFADEFPNAQIYCIDPWQGNFDNSDPCSKENYVDVEKEFDLRTSTYPNIHKIKNFSTNVDIECDVVYIDGRHFYEGVKEDILHWLPKTKKVICGHDFLKIPHPQSHINGVQKAVRETLGEPNLIFQDTSWLVWK